MQRIYYMQMLGPFPKNFSQVGTSRKYFPNWQLPKCAISQAATSQVYPSRSARPPIAVFEPQRAYPDLCEIAHLGSFHV